jgi:hypothetical protein
MCSAEDRRSAVVQSVSRILLQLRTDDGEYRESELVEDMRLGGVVIS